MDAKYLGVFKNGDGGEVVINPDHVVRLTMSGTGKVTAHLTTGEPVPLPGGLEAVAMKPGWALHEDAYEQHGPPDTFLAEHGMA